MAARRIPRTAPFPLDEVVRDYLLNRSMAERASHIEGARKSTLMGHLETAGDEVDGGHRVIEFKTPYPFVTYKSGQPKETEIRGIKRTRRTSTSLNEDKTMALLKEQGLLDQCTEVIVVLDEDKVLAANYEGKISDEVLAGLYDEKITYAFDLLRGES